MHTYTIVVSFRKGNGPQWIQQHFKVSLEELDTYVAEEEIQQWAKDDVRSQIETSKKYKNLGEHWVISEVVKVE